VPTLAGTGSEDDLEIRDLQVAEPTEFQGYAERTCSFIVALRGRLLHPIVGRRHIVLPISVRLDDTATTQTVSLDILPTKLDRAHSR
jgi:hypothetical protein